MDRICEWCKSPYQSVMAHSRYCNSRCRKTAQNKRKRDRDAVIFIEQEPPEPLTITDNIVKEPVDVKKGYDPLQVYIPEEKFHKCIVCGREFILIRKNQTKCPPCLGIQSGASSWDYIHKKL